MATSKVVSIPGTRSGHDLNGPFEKAYEDFVAVLPFGNASKTASCSSPDDLIKSLEDLGRETKSMQKRSLTRCLNVCKKISSRLHSYFDALNVLAGANTNCALVYGAFRVVLELASTFPTFFDKLIDVLDTMAQRIPLYDDIVRLFDGVPSPRMSQHLEAVYHDVFEFLRTAAAVFTSSSGKARNPLSMLATVVWKPFDTRFNDLLVRMNRHEQFVMTELQIAQAQRAKDFDRKSALEIQRAEKERESARVDRERVTNLGNLTEEMKRASEKEAKEVTMARILSWLDPPHFADSLDAVEREEGTAQWIFENPAFQRWATCSPLPNTAEVKSAKKMPPWVLWIHGNPGCGKTVLTSSVVETLSTKAWSESDTGGVTCYFFFKYDDPNSLTIDQAYRSALAQIIHHMRQDTTFLDLFSFTMMGRSTSGQQSATQNELLDLMRICANHLGQITLILDAIDEASNPDLVVRKLKLLATTSPVRLLCLSRPSVNALQTLISHPQRVTFDRDATNSDIRAFLVHHLQDMVDEDMLPETASVGILADILVTGAGGMFLWAILMLRYLQSRALTPSSRLKAIEQIRFPEGLDTMYDRILSLVASSIEPEMKLARRVLVWLYHAIPSGHPVSQDILEVAISNSVDDCDRIQDLVSVVVSVCGGLVEFTPNKFHFIHLTVREYFARQLASSPCLNTVTKSLINEGFAHIEITTRCIEQITGKAPNTLPTKISRQFKRNTMEMDRMREYGTFEEYAMVNWPEHLLSSMETVCEFASTAKRSSAESSAVDILLRALTVFLRTPLAVAFWIEGQYRRRFAPFGSVRVREQANRMRMWSNYMSIKQDLVSTTVMDISQKLVGLAAELEQIDKEWSTNLSTSPELIWDDVLLFRKGGILSKLNQDAAAGNSIVALVPDAPKTTDGGEILPLCTISTTSIDGEITGVLTVYPCPEFERFWKSLDLDTAYQAAERFSNGWIARYELWSTNSMRRLATMKIRLQSAEIALLLRQNFRETASSTRDRLVDNVTTFHFWLSHLDKTQIGNLSSSYANHKFELSFPMAISHDCQTFTVLRTVHHVTRANLRHSSETPGYICLSAVLPVEVMDTFPSKWALDQLEVFNPKNDARLPDVFQVMWRDWYTYTIAFSPDGRYLCFADYRTPCRTQLGIYEIFAQSKLEPQLRQWTTMSLGIPRARYLKFHPRYPLVLFTAETKVWIWKFSPEMVDDEGHRHRESKTTVPLQVPTQFDRCHNASTMSGHSAAKHHYTCHIHNRNLEACVVRSVVFSSCGNYVIVTTNIDVEVCLLPKGMEGGEAQPQLLPEDKTSFLPAHTTDEHEQPEEEPSTLLDLFGARWDEHEQPEEEPSTLLDLFGARCTDLPTSRILPNVMLSSVPGENSRGPTSLSLRTRNNQVTVEKSTTKMDYLHLLTTPESFDLQNSVLSLKLPATVEDSFQIIINKEMADSYTMLKNRDQANELDGQFPTVIKRKFSDITEVSTPAVPSEGNTTKRLKPL